EQLIAIVDIQLERLKRRLRDRRVALVVTDDARKLLAQRGWDAVSRARLQKRSIQRMVQDPMAMMLLEGKVGEGDTITVDVKGGDLIFDKAAAPAPAAAG